MSFLKARGGSRVGIALTLFSAISLTGCSSVLSPRSSAPDDSGLVEVKRRIVELQEQAAVAEVELDRLRREVAELRSARGYTPRPTTGTVEPGAVPSPWKSVDVSPSTGSASTGVVTQEVQPSPASGIEVTDLGAAGSLPAPVGVVSEGAPSVSSGTANEPPPPVTMAPAGADVAAAPAAISSDIPPAAQALYDEGYTLYHQGRYLDSEAVFQRFLASYGALDLTDNALYWIGECRYARGDFEGALASFQEAVARFPDGNKVPAALLKSGRCLESLGDFSGAKRAYEQVTTRFPDDPVAGVARQRVAQIQ